VILPVISELSLLVISDEKLNKGAALITDIEDGGLKLFDI